MSSFLGKTPFFRLLLPVIISTLVWHTFPQLNSPMLIPALFGLLVMLLSVFISKKKQYELRWVFGSGLFIFLISLTLIQNHYQEVNTNLGAIEMHTGQYYIGTIISIP